MHPLPQLIKIQLVKDIGVGIIVGVGAGCLFKFGYVANNVRQREEYYRQLENNRE
ncbi:hypothetical protein DICPUDRAFT_150063 [Dictyostelium purpureum]|uniref:Uncharacterized protein n=1 Tax=Dictyostelium purpureum TaxID=5786 RepID=F0ZFD1_DICPU|nr:uncharacterized protein DICPUDRAFT_150063 [Dictyostelium purpureum]EGC37385.1 hypothetical protein DICPUDRAFT_150063 [Dictyostelium purpureum]|eukprot:XP_003286126.1 hypothetical protein DICPUDRAFT_150063 [Dictyostelium purpureum]